MDWINENLVWIAPIISFLLGALGVYAWIDNFKLKLTKLNLEIDAKQGQLNEVVDEFQEIITDAVNDLEKAKEDGTVSSEEMKQIIDNAKYNIKAFIQAIKVLIK